MRRNKEMKKEWKRFNRDVSKNMFHNPSDLPMFIMNIIFDQCLISKATMYKQMKILRILLQSPCLFRRIYPRVNISIPSNDATIQKNIQAKQQENTDKHRAANTILPGVS